MGGVAREQGGKEGGEEEKGKGQKRRKLKKMEWPQRAGGGVGKWSPVPESPPALVSGKCLCAFFTLSRYSCWGTASPHARIAPASWTSCQKRHLPTEGPLRAGRGTQEGGGPAGSCRELPACPGHTDRFGKGQDSARQDA